MIIFAKFICMFLLFINMPRKYPPEIQRALDALESEERKEIVRFIHDEEKVFFSELVKKLELSSKEVDSHLKELLKVGLIDIELCQCDLLPPVVYKLSSFGEDFCEAYGVYKK